jgi:hypothetical protein
MNKIIILSIFLFISSCSNDVLDVEISLNENEILFKLEESWESKRVFKNGGQGTGPCRADIDFNDSNTLPYYVMNHFSLDTLRLEFIPDNRLNSDINLTLAFNRENQNLGRSFGYVSQFKYEESLNVPKKVKYVELINFSPEKKVLLYEGIPTNLPITYSSSDENGNSVTQPIIYFDSNVNLDEVLKENLIYSKLGNQCNQLTNEEFNQLFRKEIYSEDDYIIEEIFAVDDEVNMSSKEGGIGSSVNVREIIIGDYIYLGKTYKKYKVVGITNGGELNDELNSSNNETSTPSDNSSNQSQECNENDIIDILNSFKEQEINTTYNFPFGEYNLFQRYGGSVPSGGTFNGISYLSVDFFSDANQIDNGIWVAYKFREDNGELIFGYVGIRSTDSSGEITWSNVRRYYAPNYASDSQQNFETSSICDFWEKMNGYVESL